MSKIKKIFLTLSAISLIFPLFPAPSQAAAGPSIYFTSVRQNYEVGENIYVKVRVEPSGQPINVVRAISNFNTGPAQLMDQRLDGSWFYPSPGSFADGAAGVVNQGGFLLAQSVSADSPFMTLEFKAAAVGTLTLNIDPSSLLIDTDMLNRLSHSTLQPYSIIIGPAVIQPPPTVTPPPPGTPPPPPGTPAPPAGPYNRSPVINDIGEIMGVIGEKITLKVSASDPDGDNVTFSSADLPEGATLNSQTGEFNWTPGSQNIYFVTFTATDDSALGPLSSTKKVRITVFCSVVGGGQSQLSCPAPDELAGTICPICQNEVRVFAQVSRNKRDPQIISPSHPDQNKWYSNDLVNLRWTHDTQSLGYSMTFDRIEGGEPSSSYFDLLEPQITYKEVPTGAWFFHMKVRYEDGWSKTYHYKVKVDTISPKINISDVQGQGANAKLNFTSSDIGSGVAGNQYRLDKGEWATAASPLDISNFSKESTLSLRVRDNADNVSEVSLSLGTFKQTGDESQYVLFPPPELSNPAPTIDNLVTRKVTRSFTNSHVLIFTGRAEPFSSVILVFNDDRRLYSSASTDATGVWQMVFDKNLAIGTHTVYATSIKENIVSPKSMPLTFTIDDEVISVSFNWGAFILGAMFVLTFMALFSVVKRYTKQL